MSDLDKLIEAVEAGFPDYALLEYDGFCDTFRQEFRDAFHGSLDAAKALHEALLPGWGWEVNRLSALVTGTGEKRFFGQRFSDIQSRLWLIAILKAYRSLQ